MFKKNGKAVSLGIIKLPVKPEEKSDKKPADVTITTKQDITSK